MSRDPVPEPTVGLLITEVARLLRHHANARARGRRFSQAEWQTLSALSRCEGVNQATLAQMIEIHPATLTKVIDRLARAGLVERRRDSGDRRAFLLVLTERARPLVEEMRSLGEAIREQALASVPEGARRQLVETLQTMKANLLPGSAE